MRMPARRSVARSVAVVGAMLLGVAALMLFAWSSQEWLRVLIVMVLLGGGIAINGKRNDYGNDPVAKALGDDVKAGIGASATFVGAYLVGPLILSFNSSPPSAAVVILLIFGFPLLALLRFATREMAVGMIGAALLVPVLGAVLLAQAGVGASTVAVIAIVVAVVMFALVLARPKDWELAQPISVFGATAASFAVGAGASSVGTLAAQQQDSTATSAVPALPPAPQVVVLAIGLLVAVGFVLLALARHHVASGIVAGSVLAVPPTSLLVNYVYGAPLPAAALAVLVAVPIIAALIAAVALVVPNTRRLLRLVLPPHLRPARPVVGASAFRAVIGVALVVVAPVVPLLGHAYRTQGVIVAVLLAVAAALAWWLPGTPGAVLAGVVLVELGLDIPWWRIVQGWGTTQPGLIITSVIGLVVTAAVAVALLLRHRRPGVFAAAAYALAGTLATLLASLAGRVHNDQIAVVWLVGPLVLLAIPAAVAVLRGRGAAIVVGQAVGCVLLAGGGFALARLLLPVTNTSNVTYGVALAPLIPTSTGVGGGFPGTAGIPVAAVAMFVIAVPLLVSTVRRPSAPLVAAGVFVIVESAAACVVGVADHWTSSSVNTLVFVVLIVAVIVSAVAAVLVSRQGLSTPTAP